ncbi:hypothetical protein VKT23_003491 [Stygiomarasmius scandens]|uniref:Uncharacterized protein n=1 Tax=Marasmiellus scandens TaxID=2682957 RepID=A0ABR1K0E3_9AGAR
MFSDAFEVTDCFWKRSNIVDAYTHLRLLKNGSKSHSYKVSFGKNSTGGSTGWKFRFDGTTTYSIEAYTSVHHVPFTRRISMNEDYETKIITFDDFEKFRDVKTNESSSSQGSFKECDVKMAFGIITLRVFFPTTSLHDRLHNVSEFIAKAPVSAILQYVERLEPTLDRLSRFGDVISIHPVVRGIVLSFQGIYQELKGMSKFHKEIYALVEEMCHMVDHLEKIKSCIQMSDGDEMLKQVLPKMESVMKDTCDLITRLCEDSKKGKVPASLSNDQIQRIRRLQTQFCNLKCELDRHLAFDVFIKTRQMAQRLNSLPMPSTDNLRKESADSWSVNSTAFHVEAKVCA